MELKAVSEKLALKMEEGNESSLAPDKFGVLL